MLKWTHYPPLSPLTRPTSLVVLSGRFDTSNGLRVNRPCARRSYQRLARFPVKWPVWAFHFGHPDRAFSEWPTIRPLVPINTTALLGSDGLIVPR